MNPLVLPVNPGTLDSGFCPATLQEMLVGFSAKQSVTFPDTFAGVTMSSTKPVDTTQAWYQLDSLGRPVRLYTFAQGAWLSLHPCVPGFTMIWTSALPNFNTFDGGDANALSPISGPMWEVVTALAARVPLGAGTLPISTTVVAIGDTGGEEKHVITTAELPIHNHPRNNENKTEIATLTVPGDTIDTNFGTTQNGKTTGITGNTGGDQAHQNMPPYLGVAFLRRTARLFYAVN